MRERAFSPQKRSGHLPSFIHGLGRERGLSLPVRSQNPTRCRASSATGPRSSTVWSSPSSGIERTSLGRTRRRYRQIPGDDGVLLDEDDASVPVPQRVARAPRERLHDGVVLGRGVPRRAPPLAPVVRPERARSERPDHERALDGFGDRATPRRRQRLRALRRRGPMRTRSPSRRVRSSGIGRPEGEGRRIPCDLSQGHEPSPTAKRVASFLSGAGSTLRLRGRRRDRFPPPAASNPRRRSPSRRRF